MAWGVTKRAQIEIFPRKRALERGKGGCRPKTIGKAGRTRGKGETDHVMWKASAGGVGNYSMEQVNHG